MADVVLKVEAYQLNNGYSIDGGTITVTDTADANGMLDDASEIVSWDIDVTFGNAGSFTFSSDLAGHALFTQALNQGGFSMQNGELRQLGDGNFQIIRFRDTAFSDRVLEYRGSNATGISEFQVRNNGDAGTQFSFLNLPSPALVATAVPEPASLGTLAFGSAFFLLRRRRRA